MRQSLVFDIPIEGDLGRNKENPLRFTLQALSSVLCVVGGAAAIVCSSGMATGPVVAANVAGAALCGRHQLEPFVGETKKCCGGSPVERVCK